MKKIDVISKGEGYNAVELGSFDKIGEYSMIHPKLKTEVFGKVFLKEITGATGTEISLIQSSLRQKCPIFTNTGTTRRLISFSKEAGILG